MTWNFGDGFDLYATATDMINGYWDSGTNIGNVSLVAGRFSGSRGILTSFASNVFLVKSSGVNDTVHHIGVAANWPTFSGSTQNLGLQLVDGTTAQCTIMFRTDGAIVLTSGGTAGTVLATYTGVAAAAGTWYGLEFEVVINNTTGSFTVRKNGNTSNDFTAAGLNTRGGTANNYANRLQIVSGTGGGTLPTLDDLFWSSGAATGSWLGDIRCITRMPASDVTAVFSKAPTNFAQTPFTFGTTTTYGNTTARYTPIVAAYDGTVGAISLSVGTGFTGNLKCSAFNGTATGPTTVLSSATTLSNPATGSNTITFPTPFTVAKGAQYWIGFETDVSASFNTGGTNTGRSSTTAYTSFPVASPTVANDNAPVCSWTITIGTNNCLVNEAQEDGLTTYVYDSTVNDADFYTIGTIASTPLTTIAVTTRGYMQKSDAGSRTAAVQLKSGTTTVATPTLTLSTSGFLWAWRTDLTDPNTGSGWLSAAVSAINVGPLVVS